MVDRTMQPFEMERWQSHYENRVRWNLSESGVHPLTLDELLELGDAEDRDRIQETVLGYGQSNGTTLLRDRIAALYEGATADDVVVTNGSAEANFVTAWRLIRPDDAVAVLTPMARHYSHLHLTISDEPRALSLRLEGRNGPPP